MKIYATRQQSDEELFNKFLGKPVWVKVHDDVCNCDWYLRVVSKDGTIWKYNLMPNYVIDSSINIGLLGGIEHRIFQDNILSQFRIADPLDVITDAELRDILYGQNENDIETKTPTNPNKFVGKPVWVRVEYYSDGFDEPSDDEYFKFHSIEGSIVQVNMLPAFCIDDPDFHVSSSSDLEVVRGTFTDPLSSTNLHDVDLKFIKITEPLEILTDEEFLDKLREACGGRLDI